MKKILLVEVIISLIMTVSSKNEINNKNRTVRIDKHLPGNQSSEGTVNMKETTIQIRISKAKKDNWVKEAEKFDKTLTRFIVDVVDGVIDKTITTDPIELKVVIDEILNEILDRKKSDK